MSTREPNARLTEFLDELFRGATRSPIRSDRESELRAVAYRARAFAAELDSSAEQKGFELPDPAKWQYLSGPS